DQRVWLGTGADPGKGQHGQQAHHAHLRASRTMPARKCAMPHGRQHDDRTGSVRSSTFADGFEEFSKLRRLDKIESPPMSFPAVVHAVACVSAIAGAGPPPPAPQQAQPASPTTKPPAPLPAKAKATTNGTDFGPQVRAMFRVAACGSDDAVPD